ncbi:hypothetical protein [Streptomyces sp. NPDC005209]|uniref:hypothetical protein n=1 Tax=Streptomyces sp. NPDC005209 TaxID=3156715 RepID=UPI0033B8CDD5
MAVLIDAQLFCTTYQGSPGPTEVPASPCVRECSPRPTPKQGWWCSGHGECLFLMSVAGSGGSDSGAGYGLGVMAEGDEDGLLADVRRTLVRAGFDLASSEKDADGLRVRREADAVVVTWEPGSGLDPGGLHHSDHEGMRSALRHALTLILAQTGHAVRVDRDTGEVQVRPLL